MEWDLFNEIVTQIQEYPWREVPILIPFSHGEPTVYPQFLESCERLDATGFPFLFSVNGTGDYEALVKVARMKGCSEICVSLDGLDSATRAIFRPGAQEAADQAYHLITDGRQQCRTSVSLLNIGQPWDEIQEFIDFWLTVGADRVIIRRPLPQDPLPAPLEGWEDCCYLHNWYLVIKSDGRVKLCERYSQAPIVAKLPELSLAKAIECMTGGLVWEAGKTVCPTCPQRYVGETMYGRVTNRLSYRDWFIRMDYFNTMYSFTDLQYGAQWEAQG
jgi:hypothetical protein